MFGCRDPPGPGPGVTGGREVGGGGGAERHLPHPSPPTPSPAGAPSSPAWPLVRALPLPGVWPPCGWTPEGRRPEACDWGCSQCPYPRVTLGHFSAWASVSPSVKWSGQCLQQRRLVGIRGKSSRPTRAGQAPPERPPRDLFSPYGAWRAGNGTPRDEPGGRREIGRWGKGRRRRRLTGPSGALRGPPRSWAVTGPLGFSQVLSPRSRPRSSTTWNRRCPAPRGPWRAAPPRRPRASGGRRSNGPARSGPSCGEWRTTSTRCTSGG